MPAAELSATQCAECGVWHDPARRHRCARLAPRALPDVAPPPAPTPLPPVDPRAVVEVVLAWDATRDLERLAAPAVQRHYYGRGVALEPTVRATGGAAGGPLDHLSARARAELHAIHRRFEALRAGPGCLHYQVLRYAFLDTAAEQRYASGAVARHASGALADRFLVGLGRAFATPAQRRAWRGNPAAALRTALPRAYAQRLYDAAVAAYDGRGGTVAT
jgi:hypothetical protein